MRDIKGNMAEALLHGGEHDVARDPDNANVYDLRDVHAELIRLGYSTEQFAALPVRQQNRVSHRVLIALRQRQKDRWLHILESTKADPSVPGARSEMIDTMMGKRGGLPRELLRSQKNVADEEERTRLFKRLTTWSRGELRLERPQGSSFHHLVQYDAEHTENGLFSRSTMAGDVPQLFVMMHDWGSAFNIPAGGDWPLPFDYCCFEFRISGVRVLSFFFERNGVREFFSVYGLDNCWVTDDYRYELRGIEAMCRPIAPEQTDNYRMEAVARTVLREVRAACVMLDARVAQPVARQVSQRLVEKRVAEKRAPPRDHFVVDLTRAPRAVTHQIRGSGAGSADRAPQRGHFRMGTWVHYDDPASGQVECVNDGGFWVSKTWRHWHFAGDPKNIIVKEYRL